MRLIDIPQIEYWGYLWFDDSDQPVVVDGPYDFTRITDQPFIIEGNLKAKDGSISISIRFLDGLYVITEVDLQKALSEGVMTISHEYIAHGFGDGRTIKFIEAWIDEQDPYCCGMETLRPAWLAFDGFGQLQGGTT